MKAVTSLELIQMFRLQEALNIAYKGEEWDDVFTIGQIKAALMTEVGEFLEETTSQWKIWIKNTKFDKQKAIFEFIDVVHFMLMLSLFRHSDDTLCTLIETSDWLQDSVPLADDNYDALISHMTNFLRSIDMHTVTGQIYNIMATMEIASRILGMEPGEMFKAYQLKNELNLERAKGGLNYDRSNERVLILE